MDWFLSTIKYMKKKETKLQELERRIVELEKARVVTIIQDYPIPGSNQPVYPYPLTCTCNTIVHCVIHNHPTNGQVNINT